MKEVLSMKKIISFLAVILTALLLVACGAKEITPDFANAESFEAALNAGDNLVGKTVKFECKDFKPDSAFGYNLISGEHLNFCSPTNPNVSVGDTVIVKVTEVVSMLGSWIIAYEHVK